MLPAEVTFHDRSFCRFPSPPGVCVNLNAAVNISSIERASEGKSLVVMFAPLALFQVINHKTIVSLLFTLAIKIMATPKKTSRPPSPSLKQLGAC
jgi:hypothetical protein